MVTSAAMKGSDLPSLLVILSLGAFVVALGFASACSLDDGAADTILRLPSDREDVTDDGEEEVAVGVRPWKCCNTPRCTRSNPPTCHCMDTVKKCYSACKSCKETRPGSHRYHCLDAYKGPPGPKCNQADEMNQGVTGGVNDDDQEQKAEVAVPENEAEKEMNGLEKRPWDCCNTPRCTKSNPPTCHCMDTVKRCSRGCKSCKETRPGSHRYHCLDAYKGPPGPKCNQADEMNQGFTGGVNDDDQEQEDEVAVPDNEAEEEVNGLEKRPWDCCNTPRCTRSNPPTCHCMDTVKQCSRACKSCKETRPGSHRYHCLDSYKGPPGPKCNKDDGVNAVGSCN